MSIYEHACILEKNGKKKPPQLKGKLIKNRKYKNKPNGHFINEYNNRHTMLSGWTLSIVGEIEKKKISHLEFKTIKIANVNNKEAHAKIYHN